MRLPNPSPRLATTHIEVRARLSSPLQETVERRASADKGIPWGGTSRLDVTSNVPGVLISHYDKPKTPIVVVIFEQT